MFSFSKFSLFFVFLFLQPLWAQTPFDSYEGQYVVESVQQRDIGFLPGDRVSMTAFPEQVAFGLTIYDGNTVAVLYHVVMTEYEEYLGEGHYDSAAFSKKGDATWHGGRTISIAPMNDGKFKFKMNRWLGGVYWRDDEVVLKKVR